MARSPHDRASVPRVEFLIINDTSVVIEIFYENFQLTGNVTIFLLHGSFRGRNCYFPEVDRVKVGDIDSWLINVSPRRGIKRQFAVTHPSLRRSLAKIANNNIQIVCIRCLYTVALFSNRPSVYLSLVIKTTPVHATYFCFT